MPSFDILDEPPKVRPKFDILGEPPPEKPVERPKFDILGQGEETLPAPENDVIMAQAAAAENESRAKEGKRLLTDEDIAPIGRGAEPLPEVHQEMIEGAKEPSTFSKAKEAAFRALSPLLGPTDQQRAEDSVAVTQPDGSVRYEYKPHANEIEKRGLIPALTEAGSAVMDAPTAINLQLQGKGSTLTDIEAERQRQMIPANENDSATTAVAKAAHNALLNISHTLANPAMLALPESRALSGLFAADMAHGTYEQAKQISEAPTLQGKIEAAVSTVLSAAMTGMAGVHAVKGKTVAKTQDEIAKESQTKPGTPLEIAAEGATLAPNAAEAARVAAETQNAIAAEIKQKEAEAPKEQPTEEAKPPAEPKRELAEGISQEIVDGFWNDESRSSVEKLKFLIENKVPDEQIIKAVGGNFGKPELAKFKKENGLDSQPKEEPVSEPITEQKQPAIVPLARQIDAAKAEYQEQINRFGTKIIEGESLFPSGFEFNPETNTIVLDPKKIEAHHAEVERIRGKEAADESIRVLLGHEVTHAASAAFERADPTGGRSKTIEDWGSKKDDLDTLLGSKDSSWESKSDWVRGHEKLARVLQGKHEGTIPENVYGYLKDFVAWMKETFAKLTPQQKEIVDSIEAMLKRHEVEPTQPRAPESVKSDVTTEKPPEQMSPAERKAAKIGMASHEAAIEKKLKAKEPVNAESVQEYGLKIPAGYVQEGELLVHKKPEIAEPTVERVVTEPKQGSGPKIRPLNRKAFEDRLATAEITDAEIGASPEQVIEIDRMASKSADKVIDRLGIPGEKGGIFWQAAKDEIEIRARKWFKEHQSLEGAGWNTLEGTALAEVVRSREWVESQGRSLDEELSEDGDTLLDLVASGQAIETSLTPEQKETLRHAEAAKIAEKAVHLAAIKDPEFLKTLTPLERQLAEAQKAQNPTVKEILYEKLTNMAAKEGDADAVIADTVESLNDKIETYGKTEETGNNPPHRESVGKSRTDTKAEARVPETRQEKEVEEVFPRSEIEVSKPAVTRRKHANGTDGRSVTAVQAPSSITSPDKWHSLGIDKVKATVEARLIFETGKPPAKTDKAWNVYGKGNTLIAKDLTYPEAIEVAKDHVYSANPKPESVRMEPVGGPGAMGPQEAAEMSATQGKTSIKNSKVDEERIARGLEPLEAPIRRSYGPLWDEALAALDKDPNRGKRLVEELNQKPRPITDLEDAILVHERLERKAEFDNAAEAVNNAKTPEEIAEAGVRLEAAREAYDAIDTAGKRAGTETARGLAARRLIVKDDYSLAAIEAKLRSAKGDKLTEAETKKLAEQAKEIERLEKQIEELQGEVSDAELNADVTRQFEATINELGKEYLSKPQFGREVLDIAHGIVNRWKSEAEGLDAEIKRMLSSESGSVGGAGGIGGRGKRLGAPSATSGSLITNIAKVIRARVGEAALSKAEMLAELVDTYGEKIRPLFSRSWDKAHQMISEENAKPEVKQAIRSPKSKEQTPQSVEAKAKAEAVAGEPLTKTMVKNYVKALVKSGIHGEEAVMKAAHEGLSKIYPELTERDVRRIFTDYGKAKFPNPEAVATEMRELHRLVQLQESIDREIEGLGSLRSGIQRDKATQAIREKQKQLNELLKKRKLPPSPEQLASREEAKITALKNRIADIDKELRTGEKQSKGEKLPDSDAVQTLKAERDAMQAKLDEVNAPEKNPVQKQIERLQKQRERIQQELTGTATKRTPQQFKALSQRAEDLKAEILAMQELNKELTANDRYNSSRMKAVEARIADLNERLATKNFAPKPKPATKVKSDELRKAETELARKKLEVDVEAEKERLKKRGWPAKLADTFVAVERGMKLTSDVVLAKLTVAALAREFALTPAEQAVGSAVSKVFKKLAERAPREGKPSLDAEIKAKTDLFTAGMKDAWDNLRMKKSELELKHGKERIEVPRWWDYMGYLHGALKAPIKRAEFRRSFEQRLKWAEEHGANTADPDVLVELGKQAYVDANRAIFMQDNILSDLFSGAMRSAEKSSKHPNIGPAVARIGRFLLPIVKVPTNIVGEVATGIHGGVVGGGRAGYAYFKGVESLPPEQADAIMRQIKKGLIGNALILTGYFSYQSIGGFYHKGEDREESDVKAGHYRIGDVDLPHSVDHSTASILMDIGATIARVQNETVKGENKSFGSGTLAAGSGLVKQLPFVPVMSNAAEALDSENGFTRYIGSMISSTTTPSLISHLARVEDTPGSFPANMFDEPTKRDPKTIGDYVKSGIPRIKYLERLPNRTDVAEKVEKATYNQLVHMLENNQFSSAASKIAELKNSGKTKQTRNAVKSRLNEHLKKQEVPQAYRQNILRQFDKI